MSPSITTRYRISDLNDAFRKAGPVSGQWMLTRGVADQGAVFVALATRAVQVYDRFRPEDDPYGEHDFGSFLLAGQKLFWKIDYYDSSLSYGSDNPADPNVTRRVVTIMLASEY